MPKSCGFLSSFTALQRQTSQGNDLLQGLWLCGASRRLVQVISAPVSSCTQTVVVMFCGDSGGFGMSCLVVFLTLMHQMCACPARGGVCASPWILCFVSLYDVGFTVSASSGSSLSIILS